MNSKILASIATLSIALSSQVALAQTAPEPEGALEFDTGISNRAYPHSDWALINGKIWTVNPDQPWASAIVVEGNEITYVGDAEGLKNHIGIATQVVDLKGKMVVPGFVEGHFHVIAGGSSPKGWTCKPTTRTRCSKSFADMSRTIRISR